MAAKLTSDNILPKFLFNTPLVILSNLNDAIDVAVNVCPVDILKLHSCLLLQ